jgi:ABC-type amino acid transport substrate-binding protein
MIRKEGAGEMRGKAWASLLAALLVAGAAPAATVAGPGVRPSTLQAAPARPLNVGVRFGPPFVFRGKDGEWTWISAELWSEVARREKLEWRFVETSPEGLIEGLVDGTLDVVVFPLVPTLERERVMDFTCAWYRTGLGISVVRPSESRRWLSIGRTLLSAGYLKVLAGLCLSLFLAGVLIWGVERKRNPSHFEPGVAGVGEGIWWAVVTATGVGYGDRVPVTAAGRVVAVLWMLTGVLFVSAFTGSVAARVAIQHFEEIRGEDDLRRVRSAAVESTSGADFLRQRRIRGTLFGSLEEALAAVRDGRVDAVVSGEPLLRAATTKGGFTSLVVLPALLEPQTYAFGVPTESPLRERLNRRILEVMDEPVWHDICYRYFGD